MRVFLVKALPLITSLLILPLLDIDVAAAPAPVKILRVGVIETAPFAMKNVVGDWEGIGVELWQILAKRLDLTYEFVEASESDLLQMLRDGRLDAVAGGFVLTAQEEGAVEVTQPYYIADRAIGATRKPVRTILNVLLEALVSWQFLRVFLPVLGFLFLGGILMYFVERKRDLKDYAGRRPRSILYGTYWSTAMMTGVGARAPETNLGRAIAIVWILIGVILTSIFTAAITRVLTADLLSAGGPSERDLPHKLVAVLEGTNYPALRELGVRPLVFNSPEDVVGAVVRGEAAVCVMSEPVLRYYSDRYFPRRIQIALIAGRKTLYAIGLAPKSPLRKPLNIALLEFVEGPEWGKILHQYLGN